MLKLKLVNHQDGEKEYEAIKSIPIVETGFENRYALYSHDLFITSGIDEMISWGEGTRIPEDEVRQLFYFLWDDDQIVGLFKIRPQLNDEFRETAGHISYTVIRKYRRNHYGTRGLKLAIELFPQLSDDDEILMAAYSWNTGSIRTMMNNGAIPVRKASGITYLKVRVNDGKE